MRIGKPMPDVFLEESELKTLSHAILIYDEKSRDGIFNNGVVFHVSKTIS